MPLDVTRPFVPIRIAVLAVSDTRSLEDDISGAVLARRITDAGHALAGRDIVPDDKERITARLREWIDSGETDVVIATGGTGLTGRDVTPEAFRSLFEKEMDGFAFLFHQISADKISTSTMQSRACAGVCRGVYLFCLPGSPGACKDAWDGILRQQLDSRFRPCNLAEIMPRLREHIGRT